MSHSGCCIIKSANWICSDVGEESPGTVCSNGLMLNTNVYGLRTSKFLVYCYNVKVVGVTQTGTLFDFTEVAFFAEKIERRGNCLDVITELKNLKSLTSLLVKSLTALQ
uniref:Uncharacterized protein n=1 Tax=Ditylenchus dipsaci TaxID=166011 RepID=A0A915EC92_9BILA